MPRNAQERQLQAQAKSRGILRVRTVRLPHGAFAHVYVVRTAGPHGGHTVMMQPEKGR